MTNKAMFKRAHSKARQLMQMGCGCYAVAFKLALKECYAELKAAYCKPHAVIPFALISIMLIICIVMGIERSTTDVLCTGALTAVLATVLADGYRIRGALYRIMVNQYAK